MANIFITVQSGRVPLCHSLHVHGATEKSTAEYNLKTAEPPAKKLVKWWNINENKRNFSFIFGSLLYDKILLLECNQDQMNLKFEKKSSTNTSHHFSLQIDNGFCGVITLFSKYYGPHFSITKLTLKEPAKHARFLKTATTWNVFWINQTFLTTLTTCQNGDPQI